MDRLSPRLSLFIFSLALLVFFPGPAFGDLDWCTSPLPAVKPPPHLDYFALKKRDGSVLNLTPNSACMVCHYKDISLSGPWTECLTCHAIEDGFEWSIEDIVPAPYECERCHGPAPADPAVDCKVHPDSAYPAPIGLSGSGCLKWAFPEPYPTGFGSAKEVVTHSSATTSPGYGNWYVHCVHCHNPHEHVQPFPSQSGQSQFGNYFKGEVCYKPKDGRVLLYMQPFELIAADGPGSFADGIPYPENLCNTCHTMTRHHQAGGTAPGGQAHYDGQDCTTCHLHEAGFSPAGGGEATAPHNTEAFAGNCQYCHVEDAEGNIQLTWPVPNTKCNQCHTDGGALKGLFPTAPSVATHAPGGVEIDCVACHDPMFPVGENIKLIRHEVASSVLPFPESTVVFTALSGAGSFADGPPHEDNVCETCHSQANHHQYDGTAPGGQEHFDGDACITCHTHLGGFSATAVAHPEATTNCSICHDSSDVPGVHGNNCTLCHTAGFGSTFLGPSGTWGGECSECHNPARAETGNRPTPTKGHRCTVCHGVQLSTSSMAEKHKRHIEYADCVVCHGFIPNAGTAIGSGNRDVCKVCHGGVPSGSIQRIHEEHVPEGAACEECHGGTNPRLDPAVTISNICLLCHSSRHPSEFTRNSASLHEEHVDKRMDCAFCHADFEALRASINRSSYNECAFCHGRGKSGSAKSVHRRHVDEQWQWCFNCHQDSDTRPASLVPPLASCTMCHSSTPSFGSLTNDVHMRHSRRASVKCYVCHGLEDPISDWPDFTSGGGSDGGWGGDSGSWSGYRR